MGNFAKALRYLANSPPDSGGVAAPTARGLTAQTGWSPNNHPDASRHPSFPRRGIRSTVDTNPFGSHYVIHADYPHDYFQGRIRLSRLCTADLAYLMTLMRETGSVPPRDRILFLDTETTGIQGGSGMCPFMVGLGYFIDDEFQMRQYFIRDFDEEPSMLYALAEFLRSFHLVVTYNGAAFDIPLLETRFTLARLDNAFENVSHLDLLKTTRRLWRQGHGSCRLVALEREIISFDRGPDVHGSLIPRAYFDYIQRRQSATLLSVFTHNVYDVVSLAADDCGLRSRHARTGRARRSINLYSLARVLQRAADFDRSKQLYEMALEGGLQDPIRTKALASLSILHRRMSRPRQQVMGFS